MKTRYGHDVKDTGPPKEGSKVGRKRRTVSQNKCPYQALESRMLLEPTGKGFGCESAEWEEHATEDPLPLQGEGSPRPSEQTKSRPRMGR